MIGRTYRLVHHQPHKQLSTKKEGKGKATEAENFVKLRHTACRVAENLKINSTGVARVQFFSLLCCLFIYLLLLMLLLQFNRRC